MRKKKKTRAESRNWLPYLVYSLLSLAILGPLLLPGYILTLDMVFATRVDIAPLLWGLDEWGLTTSAPFWVLTLVASKVFPTWMWQKVILFSIFFLAGLGAHRLFPFRTAGSYFAGLLYMVNPFTYVRFLAGQWGVLAAYAMTPWAIKAFLELLEQGGKRKAIKFALLATSVGIVQMHGFLLLFLALGIIFLAKIARDFRQRAEIVRHLKYIGLSALVLLGMNFYWLLPAVTLRDTVLQQITQLDLLFFAPKPTSDLGVMFDLTAMYGFWRGGYISPKDLLPLWWLIFAFIFFLAVYGFFSVFRHQKLGWIAWSFAVLWFFSFILALGTATALTRPLAEWLFSHIPLFPGFRDSQKFIALLGLSYSYLGGLGVHYFTTEAAEQLGNWGRKWLASDKLYPMAKSVLTALALLAPLVYSYFIFGFHGQLKTTDYPREWYEVRDYLNQDKGGFTILFLPWHLYMDYHWLPNRDKRLENPAPVFFSQPVTRGDNLEAGPIYSQSLSPLSKYMEFLLEHRGEISNFGELLAPLNVKYVILVHEADYASYQFLSWQTDLTSVIQKKNITLFQNQHSTARAYAVDNIVYVKDLEDYLHKSLEQDVMQHLYILGEGTDTENGSGFQPLELARDSLVKYEITGSDRKWGIFTLPQGFNIEHWRYNGERIQVKNLGFMLAFPLDEKGGELVYSRFYFIFLPAYLVSLFTVVGVVLWWKIIPRRGK